MRIAMLGCGYVANMYRLTLPMHPELQLIGVHDREASRTENMARLTGARAYPDLDALLGDPEVELVLNLTTPEAHYETTKALLEAGKHVYTEKPLAMRVDEGEALVALAERKGLMLSGAPCTLMNPAAQTLWRALRKERAGPVRLVYAEMDDGMVHRAPTAKWINEAGTAWPAINEFETGCTVEHAGYVLSWLCAFFGPVERMTAFSETLVPQKVPGRRLTPAPDFSVASLVFASGVVARLTNGLYADHDHRLRLFGDDGVLDVEDPRRDDTPVRLRRYMTLRRRRFLSPRARRLKPLGGRERIAAYRGSQSRDFCRAIADMAAAAKVGRKPYLDGHFLLHVAETTLACHRAIDPDAEAADGPAMPYRPRTRFEPLEPLA
ncbi:MAG: Gfo/Idh/MocA family oxidoreductase [Pseudomonadota bacterium]